MKTLLLRLEELTGTKDKSTNIIAVVGIVVVGFLIGAFIVMACIHGIKDFELYN